MTSKNRLNSDIQETINLLQALLQDAEAGAIDGIACVCLTRDHQGHLRDIAGSAGRYAAHTLGGLRLLSDDLSAACRQDPRAQTTTPEPSN